jgi:hypothetical protein
LAADVSTLWHEFATVAGLAADVSTLWHEFATVAGLAADVSTLWHEFATVAGFKKGCHFLSCFKIINKNSIFVLKGNHIHSNFFHFV